MISERNFLRPLPQHGMDLTEVSFPTMTGGLRDCEDESPLDSAALRDESRREAVACLYRDLE